MRTSFGISADSTFSTATLQTLRRCGFSSLETDGQNLDYADHRLFLKESEMSIAIRNIVPPEIFYHITDTPSAMLRMGLEEMFYRRVNAAADLQSDFISAAPDIERNFINPDCGETIVRLIRALSRPLHLRRLPIFFHYRLDRRSTVTPEQLANWLKELMLPDSGYLFEAIPDEDGLYPIELFRECMRLIPVYRTAWKLSAGSTALMPANTNQVISMLNTCTSMPESGVVKIFFSLTGQSLTSDAAEDLSRILKPFVPATAPTDKQGYPRYD